MGSLLNTTRVLFHLMFMICIMFLKRGNFSEQQLKLGGMLRDQGVQNSRTSLSSASRATILPDSSSTNEMSKAAEPCRELVDLTKWEGEARGGSQAALVP